VRTLTGGGTTATDGTSPATAGPDLAHPRWRSSKHGPALDLIAIAVLTAAAYIARRGSLPSDGLWFDDSWVAAGAILGRPTELLTVGSGHPGYTAILMAVDRLGGGDLAHLGIPSLLFGVLAPGALYLGLRAVGYERAISLILGAALAVAPVPILYSGRVKGYTLDTLVVLLIAVVVPFLARRRWHWPEVSIWVAAAVVLGTFSGYTLLATAGAGVILVLHPSADRPVRILAVGTQAVIQGAYLLALRSRSDLAGVEEVMETAFDGHMTFSWNPLTFARELLKHLRRVAEVFPGSPGDHGWWLALLAVLSVAGLALSAIKGRRSETVAARYLLLLVVVAAGGSLVDQFPFGPSNRVPVSAGGRHMLWMVPALAFGLAALAHRARLWAARRDPLRRGFDALMAGTAIAILMLAYEPAPEAPFPGSDSAAQFVDASIQPDDVVIVTNNSTFSYAISTTTRVDVQPTPDHQIGFAPDYLDPRVHNVGGWAATSASPADIRAWTADADRVFVVSSGVVGGRDRQQVGAILGERDFRLAASQAFLWAAVDVYRR
jgi:hypothetical protein